MKRRAFTQFVAGAAAWPLVAGAQQRRMPTIGVLVVGSPGSDAFWRMFRDAMRELGYVEGQTVRFVFRSDEGHADRLPALAAELVRLKVDVIVPWFTPAATAAKQATRDIPIVMALAGDAVGTGLVDSLSRPGGNVTGMSGGAGDLSSKSVQFLRDIRPTARRLAAIVNVPDPFSKPFLRQIEKAGAATGITIDAAMIDDPGELDSAFLALEKNRPDGMIVQPSLPIKRIAQLALKYGLPSVCNQRSFVEEGGLMSYWFDQAALYRRVAIMVDRLLKGTRPADLPVEQPTKFELVINLKTARAIGVVMPRTLLAQADEVIE